MKIKELFCRFSHLMMTMLKNVPAKVKHLPRRGFLIALLISALLTGCNLPSSHGALPSINHQRQTEIAGILNPNRLNTPAGDQAPTLSPPLSRTVAPPLSLENGFLLYMSQQGDTLPALSLRFGVSPDAIGGSNALSPTGFLPVGEGLIIPNMLDEALITSTLRLPDSEVIYGPSVARFDSAAYIRDSGGFLTTYSEQVKGETMTGAQIVQTVAIETSTNPRLLLALLEFQSGWVSGFPAGASDNRYPLGFGAGADTGLYKELMIAARLLAQGFYGWRDGSKESLTLSNSKLVRLAPELNAGSAAIMQLFSTLYLPAIWAERLTGETGFLSFYGQMFGDYQARALSVEPYLSPDISQPTLTLPMAAGEIWSLTGGPHLTWQTGTPRGAVDFAPVTGEAACAVSYRWATAAAPGLVVRSARGVVALDLDGDGDEGTGWVLVYLHMAEKDRATLGAWLAQDAPVGHPSCEGGSASGTHVHLARKFNGEWLGVGDPLPMVLSGWRAYAGAGRYEGYMQKGEAVINASPNGMRGSTVIRED